jgi:hypothetical protein
MTIKCSSLKEPRLTLPAREPRLARPNMPLWSIGQGVGLLKIVGSSPTEGDLSVGAMAFVLFELDTILACLASELLQGRAR